jgi:hypothetical protein
MKKKYRHRSVLMWNRLSQESVSAVGIQMIKLMRFQTFFLSLHARRDEIFPYFLFCGSGNLSSVWLLYSLRNAHYLKTSVENPDPGPGPGSKVRNRIFADPGFRISDPRSRISSHMAIFLVESSIILCKLAQIFFFTTKKR